MEETKEIKVIEDDIIVEIMNENPDLYDELEYNEYNIKDKLEKNAFLYQQWRILAMQEKHKLKRIEILRDEYIGKLYDELKHGDIKRSKVEIERYYIPSDKKAIQFEKLYMRQQIRVETYEAITSAFDKQGYNMSTYVKNLDL